MLRWPIWMPEQPAGQAGWCHTPFSPASRQQLSYNETLRSDDHGLSHEYGRIRPTCNGSLIARFANTTFSGTNNKRIFLQRLHKTGMLSFECWSRPLV